MGENTAQATTPEEFGKVFNTEKLNRQLELVRRRDDFAKAAMPALITLTSFRHPSTFWDSCKIFVRRFGIKNSVNWDVKIDQNSVAKAAYLYADAMIAQTKKYL